MGWSFPYNVKNKDDMVSYLKRNISANYELMESRVIGNFLWQLVKRKEDGLVVIALTLMQGGTPKDPSWGYKGLSYTDSLDCPTGFLRRATYGALDPSWLEKVLEHKSKKNDFDAFRRSVLVPGLLVTYAGVEYMMQASLGTKGWHVQRTSDGAYLRMKARICVECLKDLFEEHKKKLAA